MSSSQDGDGDRQNRNNDEKIPMPPLPELDSAGPSAVPGSYRPPSQLNFVPPIIPDDPEPVIVPPVGASTSANTSYSHSDPSPAQHEEPSDFLPPPSYEQATASSRSSPPSRHPLGLTMPPNATNAIPLHELPAHPHPIHAPQNASPTSTTNLVNVSPAGVASISSPQSPISGRALPSRTDTGQYMPGGSPPQPQRQMTQEEFQKRPKSNRKKLFICLGIGGVIFVLALIIGLTIGMLKKDDGGSSSDDDGDGDSDSGTDTSNDPANGGDGNGGSSGGGSGSGAGTGDPASAQVAREGLALAGRDLGVGSGIARTKAPKYIRYGARGRGSYGSGVFGRVAESEAGEGVPVARVSRS